MVFRVTFFVVSFAGAISLFAQGNSDETVTELLEEIVEARLSSISERDGRNRENETVDDQIGRLLVQAGQINLLKTFSESHFDQRMNLLLFDATVNQWAAAPAGGELRESYLESLRQIGPKVKYDVFGVNNLNKVIQSTDDLETVIEIVATLPDSYEYYKMEWLSRIASRYWETGDKPRAIELFNSFDIDVTRDKARLLAIERWLGSDEPNIELEFVHQLLDEFETDQTRFWGNYRLGRFHVENEDRKNALVVARRMDKAFSDRQQRAYLMRIYLGIATLELIDGQVTDEILDKIEELPKFPDDAVAYQCILALAGRSDRWLQETSNLTSVIERLTKFGFTRGCPLHLIKSSRRLDAAIDLASEFEHPWLRAKLLCQIARKITAREKSDPSDLDDRSIRLTLDILNNDQAYELMQKALVSAMSSAEPTEYRKGYVIDQPLVLADVANMMFYLGKLDDGCKAIEQLSTDPVPKNRRGDFSSLLPNQKISHQEKAISENSRNAAYRDVPFMKNGGDEAFRYIDFLIQLETGYAAGPISCVAGKFAELGKWKQAEKAFRIGVENFGDAIYFPSHLAKVIVDGDDLMRLRHWLDMLPNDKSKAVLLCDVCQHYANRNKLPSRPMIIEIASSKVQLEDCDENSAAAIDQTLMIAYWADDMKTESESILQRYAKRKNAQNYLSSLVTAANAAGLPELAVIVAAKIDNDDRRKTALLNGSLLGGPYSQHQSTALDPLKIRDREWLNAQPAAAQVAYKVQLVKTLLEKERVPNR